MAVEMTLENLDALRERTGASYAECLAALRASGGDVLAALIDLEGDLPPPLPRLGARVGRLARQAVREGIRTRLAVRHGDWTVVEVPALVGLAGMLLFPLPVAAGVAAALATRSSLELERGPLES